MSDNVTAQSGLFGDAPKETSGNKRADAKLSRFQNQNSNPARSCLLLLDNLMELELCRVKHHGLQRAHFGTKLKSQLTIEREIDGRSCQCIAPILLAPNLRLECGDGFTR